MHIGIIGLPLSGKSTVFQTFGRFRINFDHTVFSFKHLVGHGFDRVRGRFKFNCTCALSQFPIRV